MKDRFGKDCFAISEKKLFLLDMDGTIYNDDKLFDGLAEFLAGIKAAGGRYVFITNNSSRSVKDYISKMKRLGIDALEDDFLTSSQVAAALLKEKFGERLIYAQGTASFVKELKEVGLNVTTDFDGNISAVIVGFDTELSFEKLSTTCKVLTALSVPYYATNPDWVCPVSFGYVPDCGSMCFSIEKATGKAPVFIGKPSPTMIFSAMEKFSATNGETVVIGDRLYTDIASGINAGVDTVCVLSGETTLKDVLDAVDRPTYLVDSVKDLIF